MPRALAPRAPASAGAAGVQHQGLSNFVPFMDIREA